MSSKVGGAAPGFEPGISCMRVRSRSHYATGAAPALSFVVLFFLNFEPTLLPSFFVPFMSPLFCPPFPFCLVFEPTLLVFGPALLPSFGLLFIPFIVPFFKLHPVRPIFGYAFLPFFELLFARFFSSVFPTFGGMFWGVFSVHKTARAGPKKAFRIEP